MALSTLPAGPKTAAVDARVGTIAWANEDNIKTENSVGATCTLLNTEQSHWLVATNFGFSLPPSAFVIGVTVRYVRKRGASDVALLSEKLWSGGAPVGSDKSDGLMFGAAAFTSRTIGGVNDTWGLTLFGTDVNSNTFGFGVHIHGTIPAGGTGEVDYIALIIRWLPREYRYHYIGPHPWSIFGSTGVRTTIRRVYPTSGI